MTRARAGYNALMRPFTHDSESGIDLRESTWALQTLLAIASSGSFVGAGERLGISASGVSKAVTRAESRLGVVLVRRTTRKLSLTDLGRAYVARGERIVADLRTLEREVSSRDTKVEGTLRIAAPTVYGPMRLAPHLARLSRAHPRLAIELRCSDRMLDLVEDGIDVAIRMVAAPPEGLVARVLEDDRRGIYASAGYLRRKRAPSTIDGLARHRGLVYGPTPEPALTLRLVGPAGPTTVSLGVAFYSDSILAVKRAAVLGLGVAVLPTYLADKDVARGRLVELFPGALPSTRKVFALTHPGSRMPARVRALLRHLDGLAADR